MAKLRKRIRMEAVKKPLCFDVVKAISPPEAVIAVVKGHREQILLRRKRNGFDQAGQIVGSVPVVFVDIIDETAVDDLDRVFADFVVHWVRPGGEDKGKGGLAHGDLMDIAQKVIFDPFADDEKITFDLMDPPHRAIGQPG